MAAHRKLGVLSGGAQGASIYFPKQRPWTSTTGLLNVRNCWFFSILLLEAVTKHVRSLNASPTEACERELQDSWEFMEAVASRHQAPAELPNHRTAAGKLYDAWYAYEMVLKKVDAQQFSICLKCGVLPAKLGADGCAKVAINLGKRASGGQLDYTPQFEKPLWTQGELLNHCSRFLLDAIVGGAWVPPSLAAPTPSPLTRRVLECRRAGTRAARPDSQQPKKRAASQATPMSRFGRFFGSGSGAPKAVREEHSLPPLVTRPGTSLVLVQYRSLI